MERILKGGEFLAGGGGMTWAMKQLEDFVCSWVLNHWDIALRVNMFNNKGIKHYWTDFFTQREDELEQVDYVHASLECDTHCIANGGKIKNIGSYMMGWEMVRYVRALNPHVISIENVPEFKKWGPVRIKEDRKQSTANYSALLVDDGAYVFEPIKERQGEYFEAWKATLCSMGYDYHEKIMNAADYGIPQRRVRYFAWFTRSELALNVKWPEQTHSKGGKDGYKKWVACKHYINLANEGNSIFGRQFNENLPKHLRKPHCTNTLKRVAGGIKKFSPEMYFIMQYYGTGLNVQSLDSPINTIPGKDRHSLVKVEKAQFIQDFCRQDIYISLNDSVNTQVTWQTKQLVTLIKKHFISDGTFGSDNKVFSIEEALNTATGQQRHQLIQAEVTGIEKLQFIASYFNSSGRPETQVQSIEDPATAILSEANKKALITLIQKGLIDFDIKTRFLEPEELAQLTSFPKGYFTNPRLKLSKKNAVALIGNAVPPKWGQLIAEPVIAELRRALDERDQKLKAA
jgi:DNA (cytosine-5)-methyltransferase 1